MFWKLSASKFGASQAATRSKGSYRLTQRTLIASAVIGSSILLSGCGGGEPSATDIKRAVEVKIGEQTKAFRAFFGKHPNSPDAIAIEKLEKIGCKEVNKNAYNCNVSVTVAAGANVMPPAVETLDLVKTSDGWIVTN